MIYHLVDHSNLQLYPSQQQLYPSQQQLGGLAICGRDNEHLLFNPDIDYLPRPADESAASFYEACCGRLSVRIFS